MMNNDMNNNTTLAASQLRPGHVIPAWTGMGDKDATVLDVRPDEDYADRIRIELNDGRIMIRRFDTPQLVKKI